MMQDSTNNRSIDVADTDVRPHRGRPATGSAKSGAQRQAEYRLRKQASIIDLNKLPSVSSMQLRGVFHDVKAYLPDNEIGWSLAEGLETMLLYAERGMRNT